MAVAFPLKISPLLMTPEPHYIPGYGGFCPQYRYNLGKTYGKLTAELLTTPDIRHSGQLVLQSGPLPRHDRHTPAPGGATTKRRRLGDQELAWSTVPGYTGFIPRSQKFFAKTYAETTREALSAFQREQRAQEQRVLSQRAAEPQKQLITARYQTPLPALSKEAAPFIYTNAFQLQESPYYMADEDPHKFFISGYTGYVPRSRFLIATGYPITTNRALIEFGHMTRKKSARVGGKSEPGKENKQNLDPGHIYPEDLGLLPRYTGYVPGYKFQYGHTYGNLTQNALGQSTLQKQLIY